jgi:Na+/H+ antiporter NhaC
MTYGFLAILPPLVAVVLAVLFKNVLVSLFIGAYLGVVILKGGNPLAGLTSLIQDHVFVQAADSYNSSLLVMMIFIGGFVGVVTHSGGAAAFAERASHWFNTRARAQIAVWLGGIAVFFTDSGSPLILGPTFQPITDKLRVSREKLAWLLDCTSSPVCILIPFIGWGV